MKTTILKIKKTSQWMLLAFLAVLVISCSKDDDGVEPGPPVGTEPAIVLDCDYFLENPNAVLQDNPEAPIDYIITCVMRIEDNLTIEPGVVIAFEQDAGLNFRDESSFKMQGTAEKPILLTGVEQTKGFWSGIYTQSSNAANLMSYVTIDYAGGNEIAHGYKSGLTVFGENSPLILQYCTISNSQFAGMTLPVYYDKDEQNVLMSNCTLTKNDVPLNTTAACLRMFNGTNNFAGNTNDYVYLDGGNIWGDATWAKLDVPYLMKNTENHGFQVVDGILTVEPGTEIMMTSRSFMEVNFESSLIMVGTSQDPIIVRGEEDVVGFWDYIYISSESILNEIGYVNIQNAGITSDTPNGAIQLGISKSLNIHDVVFSNCFEYGVSLEYDNAYPPFNLEYSNLSLDNTPKLFSDWNGDEVTNP